MGKAYVKFMVENPEYLKLMFLSDNVYTVKIEDNKFYGDKGTAFEIFKNSVEGFFKEINLEKDLYMQKTLIMWSMVHGVSILIIKKNIEYKGDYLELVEGMIKTSLAGIKENL